MVVWWLAKLASYDVTWKPSIWTLQVHIDLNLHSCEGSTDNYLHMDIDCKQQDIFIPFLLKTAKFIFLLFYLASTTTTTTTNAFKWGYTRYGSLILVIHWKNIGVIWHLYECRIWVFRWACKGVNLTRLRCQWHLHWFQKDTFKVSERDL